MSCIFLIPIAFTVNRKLMFWYTKHSYFLSLLILWNSRYSKYLTGWSILIDEKTDKNMSNGEIDTTALIM